MDLHGFGDQDLNWAFKTANLTVAGLAVLSGLSQLFQDFHSFILGIYVIGFGALVGLLEFRVPIEAHTYGSFLFSFLGRGIFYTLIGSCLSFSGFFSIAAGMIIIIIGVAYIVLEGVPSISPPENMSLQGGAIGIHDEDVV